MQQESIVSIDILKRLSRRSIGIHITEDGRVEVRAPYFVPQFVIRRFVQSKKDWIVKTKKAVLSRPKIVKQAYREGAVIRLGGTSYMLHITDGNHVIVAGSRLFFPKKFMKKAKMHMEQFCRKFARHFLSERLHIYAKQMGVTYARISIRDTSSRWGSCSSTGTISFSYRLILADLSIIDYVVIHELSHITHKHHKPDFWKRVGEFYPNYKVARAWLRTQGHTLRI